MAHVTTSEDLPHVAMYVEPTVDAYLIPDQSSVGTPVRHGHRVPWQQYVRVGFFSVLLLLQYTLTRVVCKHGIPHDCHDHYDKVEIVHDFQQLFTFGFMLSVLTGIHLKDRFDYLFCVLSPRPRGFVFLILFFGASPGFGSLDLLPFLTHFTLKPGQGGINEILLYGVCGGAAMLVLWHFWLAWRDNPWQGFLSYTVSRLVIWAFYAAYFVAASDMTAVTFHLHHYIAGFLVALLAEFNHPLSLILLALGAGVFVQGIAAYDAAPPFDRKALFI